MSLFDIFMKSPNSERTDFCRALEPKEMDSALNLRPKSLCFGKKIFFKIFEKNSQNYALFGQKSEKIRKMISKPLAQFSSKKFDYNLNLPYKHILFE